MYSDIFGIYSGESEEFKEFKDERDELLVRLKENKDKVKLRIKNMKANTICEAEKAKSEGSRLSVDDLCKRLVCRN